jgi:hypothetical protein
LSVDRSAAQGQRIVRHVPDASALRARAAGQGQAERRLFCPHGTTAKPTYVSFGSLPVEQDRRQLFAGLYTIS